MFMGAVSMFPVALTAYREIGGRVVVVAVTWSVGALAWRFACVSFSSGRCYVLSYMHTFWRLRRRARTLAPLPYLVLFALACVGIPLALLVSLGLRCVSSVAVVRSPVACGSLLSFM